MLKYFSLFLVLFTLDSLAAESGKCQPLRPGIRSCRKDVADYVVKKGKCSFNENGNFDYYTAYSSVAYVYEEWIEDAGGPFLRSQSLASK